MVKEWLNKVVLGDNRELLKQLPDNSIECVVTDPPYGLSDYSDIVDIIKSWIETGEYEHKKKGFMGREWDGMIPSPNLWKEVFRVMKPGAYALVFAGSRTQDLMGLSLRLAGFELVNTIMWIYGSGFPKSLDISKVLDKKEGAEREVIGEKGLHKYNPVGMKNTVTYRSQKFEKANLITSPATEAAKLWDGYGTDLKPGYEPIILCKKPNEGTYAENVLKWGAGALNIDGCRVSCASSEVAKDDGIRVDLDRGTCHIGYDRPNATKFRTGKHNNRSGPFSEQGRFPSNLLFSHHPECKVVGVKSVPSNGAFPKTVIRDRDSGVLNKFTNEHKEKRVQVGDSDGNETIEDFDCHKDCPVKQLNEQAGIKKSGFMKQNQKRSQEGGYHGGFPQDRIGDRDTYGDEGFVSRFFKQFYGSVEDTCNTNYANIVNNPLFQTSRLADFVLALVAIEDDQEGSLLKNMIQPFMNEIRRILKENCEKNTEQMLYLGGKLLQELKLMSMDMLKENPVNVVVIQKLISTMMIIQNLLNTDGFVESVISDITLKSMVLGEKGLKFKYCAKPSPFERNIGLMGETKKVNDGRQTPIDNPFQRGESERLNTHCTVKSVTLMRYLAKLLRPPMGGIVLDPFMGSGTTGMAAILEDMDFIGMENVEEYKKIADQRIEFVRQNKDLILKEGLKPGIVKKVKPKDKGSGLERVFG